VPLSDGLLFFTFQLPSRLSALLHEAAAEIVSTRATVGLKGGDEG